MLFSGLFAHTSKYVSQRVTKILRMTMTTTTALTATRNMVVAVAVVARKGYLRKRCLPNPRVGPFILLSLFTP
jgi:hypothetical protein